MCCGELGKGEAGRRAASTARLKQTKLRLPTALRHVVQRNETELVNLNAVRSDIPLCIIRVAWLVALFLVGGYQHMCKYWNGADSSNLDQIPNGCCDRFCEFHTCDRGANSCPVQGSNCLGPRFVPGPLEPRRLNGQPQVKSTSDQLTCTRRVNVFFPI